MDPSGSSHSWCPTDVPPVKSGVPCRTHALYIYGHENIIADFRRDVMRFIASRRRRRCRALLAARWARRWR
jgi:hypothetical protein